MNACSFLFLYTTLFINSISLSFDLLESCAAMNLLSLFILFWSFWFLCFFGCCECCLTWIRLSFHYGKQWWLSVKSWPLNKFTTWKTIITFQQIYIMKNNDNIYMLTCMPPYFRYYCFLWRTWHVMFSQTEFQTGINICHMFLQCFRIEPHSSRLINVKNSTSNFRQFVQICCREKEREENNGNCKAFCFTRKRSKSWYQKYVK